MKMLNRTGILLASIAILLSAGCATRTVVVPAKHHGHQEVTKHIVYHAKPAKKKCWRHRGHWDCR